MAPVSQSRPFATVIVPTHDHGPTLRWSVGSALAQTVTDLEIFIIGDGVPGPAREVIRELTESDPRIRFFDHPKAPSRGEIYRHEAMSKSRGEIVCYLSDDDLWLPEHVETMAGLLANADFASALPHYRAPDGVLGSWNVDLALPWFRDLLLSGENRIGLSCGAHTMAMYRRLPEGWRTTPPGKPTDLHMWQQFLAVPTCRAVTARKPTVILFPSPQRPGWSADERARELEQWSRRMAAPDFRTSFYAEAIEQAAQDRVRLEIENGYLRREVGSISFRLSEVEQLVAGAAAKEQELRSALAEGARFAEACERLIVDHQRENAKLRAAMTELRDEVRRADDARASADDSLRAIQHSSTWRLRSRVLRLPLIRRIAAALTRGLAGSDHDV
jgi:GalNAc5-diNAcBac-PP-undecaprenol beta-1,3-glucosyltransferase